ncbi:hypothetical protein AB0912_17630 [Streptomyces sp. NPDC007084]|uniref:hypothetical protein n=1 Tax=Streptomyces sp. NPDC007084 TaxID=3154313 RepID=UPI003454A560
MTTPATASPPAGVTGPRALFARRSRHRTVRPAPVDPAREAGRTEPGTPDVWLAGLRLGG